MTILIKPIITEKMTALGEKLNRYAFLVNDDANKIQIKNEVENMYGVSVESVNTMRTQGKLKSRNTKKRVTTGRTATKKKAIITLSEGQTIDFYSNL